MVDAKSLGVETNPKEDSSVVARNGTTEEDEDEEEEERREEERREMVVEEEEVGSQNKIPILWVAHKVPEGRTLVLSETL
ncbi:hypothetical protein M0802_007088 [Mischocyttarus mexicanus]|nr:hypothetical protein M0802_007088 [Mischocyttarus mexicanus]